MLDDARILEDLRCPPGNRLEAMKGDRAGKHGIRVNDQWRLVFRWTETGPAEVVLEDCHQEAAMIPTHRIPTHPGVILAEELLQPLGITQAALARHMGIPLQRVNEIVRGKRGVSPETAWLLAGAFGTTPGFWANMQAGHDLAAGRPARKVGRIKGRRVAPQIA